MRRALATDNARAAIGTLERGCEVVTVAGGKFTVVDVIEHVLDPPGPADIAIATWTAAIADIGFAYNLLRDGRVRSIRWLCDSSFVSRQRSFYDAIIEVFGAESIRLGKVHAKFTTIVNDDWAFALRTSANLNWLNRLELFELSESRVLTGFLNGLVDELFARLDPAEQPGQSEGEIAAQTVAWMSEGSEIEAQRLGDASMRSDDVLGRDARRAGLTGG